MAQPKGRLVLENGDWFEGTLTGRFDKSYGEVVFHTGMTGYQEILTDPSYAGQIVVMTYPLIGNYGINPEDFESRKAWLSGFVTAEACEEPSHWQSRQTLSQYLDEQGVVGLTGVDTRALVKTIRSKGTMKGWIVAEDQARHMTFAINSQTPKAVERVTAPSVYKMSDAGRYHVVAVDYGVKSGILKSLVHFGCKVTVVPASASYQSISALQPDGILLSNGPGDPKECLDYLPTIRKLAETYPLMGICLGHQLLSLAFGAQTGKMHFGHRGSNHPVKDLATGRISITSQNHGYSVLHEKLPTELEVTHINVNDGSIEGVRVKGLNAWSVQFHPEACPGPQDAESLFKQFIGNMAEQEECRLATAGI